MTVISESTAGLTEPRALDTDVVIAGGGMVGLTQAWALHRAGFRVLVLEQNPRFDDTDKPGHDPRLSALSDGSWRYLQSLGVVENTLADHAAKISEVQVFNQHRFGLTRISAAQAGIEALGQVLPNATLIKQLSTLLDRQAGDWCLTGARYESHRARSNRVAVTVRRAGGDLQPIDARLLIGADGANSPVRQACGIQTEVHDYQQTAVVTTARPERPHRHTAYECFTKGGPLAVLPAAGGRVSVVWVMREMDAKHRLELSDADFSAGLHTALGGRLGGFTRLATRHTYPLKLMYPQRVVDTRTVLVGNAAHSLHPVAGQGFNLCLRDVRDLTRTLQSDRGEPVDPGNQALLAGYAELRKADYRRIIGLTDTLVRGFSLDLPGLATLRGLGLSAFDGVLPLKNRLVRATRGVGI